MIFNILVLSALIRGLDIDCGCFGTRHVEKVGFQKIGENFLLMIIGYFVYKFSVSKENKVVKNED